MIISVGIDVIPNDAASACCASGVDLAEHRVLVLLGHPLEDRAEHPARTAPRRPEVDQCQVGATDHGLEILGR